MALGLNLPLELSLLVLLASAPLPVGSPACRISCLSDLLPSSPPPSMLAMTCAGKPLHRGWLTSTLVMFLCEKYSYLGKGLLLGKYSSERNIFISEIPLPFGRLLCSTVFFPDCSLTLIFVPIFVFVQQEIFCMRFPAQEWKYFAFVQPEVFCTMYN